MVEFGSRVMAVGRQRMLSMNGRVSAVTGSDEKQLLTLDIDDAECPDIYEEQIRTAELASSAVYTGDV